MPKARRRQRRLRSTDAHEVSIMFSLNRLVEIVVYAIAVGISVRALATTWRYFWKIEIGWGESSALAGAVIGFLVVWGIDRGPRVAGVSATIIIVGYFIVKLVKKYIG